MLREEIEVQLVSLSSQWPGESVASAVMSRVNDTTPVVPRANLVRATYYTLTGVLATAIVIIGFWTLTPRSLQAALKADLTRADHAQLSIQRFSKNQWRRADIWFSRNRGFRVEHNGQVTVDDGRISRCWNVGNTDSTVVLRPSMDGIDMIEELLDFSRLSRRWKHRQEMGHDVGLNGAKYKVYMTSDNEAVPNQRVMFSVDESQRLRRLIIHDLAAGEWKRVAQITIDYETTIPDSVFEPDYPPEAKIVDVDGAFEGRFSIDEAVATAESDGILFAIHEAIPLDDGSFYIVSSVRGTREYLKEFPPTKRRLNLNYTAHDVVSQIASHTSEDGVHQLMMFTIQSRGVDYLWWLLTPARGAPAELNPVITEQGKRILRIRRVADHLHSHRRDESGTQLQTVVDLELSLDGKKEVPLVDVIAKARIDCVLAGYVIGADAALPLATSIRNGFVQFTSFDDISIEGYASDMRRLRRQMDDESGF